jgi:hypothetical protein
LARDPCRPQSIIMGLATAAFLSSAPVPDSEERQKHEESRFFPRDAIVSASTAQPARREVEVARYARRDANHVGAPLSASRAFSLPASIAVAFPECKVVTLRVRVTLSARYRGPAPRHSRYPAGSNYPADGDHPWASASRTGVALVRPTQTTGSRGFRRHVLTMYQGFPCS